MRTLLAIWRARPTRAELEDLAEVYAQAAEGPGFWLVCISAVGTVILVAAMAA